MMTSDWTSPANRRRDAEIEASGFAPIRDPDHGYGRALSLAYRQVSSDLPDDLRALLARLN